MTRQRTVLPPCVATVDWHGENRLVTVMALDVSTPVIRQWTKRFEAENYIRVATFLRTVERDYELWIESVRYDHAMPDAKWVRGLSAWWQVDAVTTEDFFRQSRGLGASFNVAQYVQAVWWAMVEHDRIVAALTTVPGVTWMAAERLLEALPELGTLSNKKIVSLAGVAPRPVCVSGGRHSARTGRKKVRQMLGDITTVALMVKNSDMVEYYAKQRCKGQRRQYGLFACMQKMCKRLNAVARQARTGKEIS